MLFEQLGLSTDLLRAVADQGYKIPTPIQQEAIPAILEGKDVLAGAQTGTGKTAGFTLPMLRRLEVYANTSVSPAKHPIRALILVPTRELAMQVYESVENYSKYTSLKSTLVYGGVNIDTQVAAVRSGVEILVATPGRLLDHIQQKTLTLSKAEILILDEADRMLDMGFLPDIKKILSLLPIQRQNLMFSATFSTEIKKLAQQLLREPVLVEVAKKNSVSDLITHRVYLTDSKNKTDLLVHLMNEKKLNQVLVFHRTKYGADRLAKKLTNHGIKTAAIHGDKNQQQRCQALDDFKIGSIQVLVATDVAARGLDIDELSCVVNFELPNSPEDYVHRIGRTGRAGVKGHAISLVCPEEKKSLAGIEQLLKKKIKVEKASKFENNTAQPRNAKEKNDLNGKHNIKQTRPAERKKAHAVNKTKETSEFIYFDSERIYNDKKPHDVYNDPLFTQPYVSEEPKEIVAKRSDINEKLLNQKKRRYGTSKPVPALFAPPVNNKG